MKLVCTPFPMRFFYYNCLPSQKGKRAWDNFAGKCTVKCNLSYAYSVHIFKHIIAVARKAKCPFHFRKWLLFVSGAYY